MEHQWGGNPHCENSTRIGKRKWDPFNKSSARAKDIRSPRPPIGPLIPAIGTSSANPKKGSTTQGCRVFISNLPYETSEQDLQEFFRGHLTISIHLPKILKSNLTRYAFANFSNPVEAQLSIAKLHGKIVRNRKVSLSLAREPDNRSRGAEAIEPSGDIKFHRNESAAIQHRGVSLSRAPISSQDHLPPKPMALPADHPLILEMKELKESRKNRQYYWVGLIEDLGEDEWGNPANYDRQRWEEEQQLADQKFEELAGQIKLAELGIAYNLPPPIALQSPEAETHDQRLKHTNSRKEQDRDPSRKTKERAQSSRRQLNQDSKIGSKTPIHWSEKGKMNAVEGWMEEMGMPSGRIPEEPIVIGDSSGDEAGMSSNSIYGPTDASEALDLDDGRKGEEIGVDDLKSGAVTSRPTIQDAMNRTLKPIWTAAAEATYEKAEASRALKRTNTGLTMGSKGQNASSGASPSISKEFQAKEPVSTRISPIHFTVDAGVERNIVEENSRPLNEGRPQDGSDLISTVVEEELSDESDEADLMEFLLKELEQSQVEFEQPSVEIQDVHMRSGDRGVEGTAQQLGKHRVDREKSSQDHKQYQIDCREPASSSANELKSLDLAKESSQADHNSRAAKRTADHTQIDERRGKAELELSDQTWRTRETPTAADFWEIDNVDVETLNMQDTPIDPEELVESYNLPKSSSTTDNAQLSPMSKIPQARDDRELATAYKLQNEGREEPERGVIVAPPMGKLGREGHPKIQREGMGAATPRPCPLADLGVNCADVKMPTMSTDGVSVLTEAIESNRSMKRQRREEDKEAMKRKRLPQPSEQQDTLQPLDGNHHHLPYWQFLSETHLRSQLTRAENVEGESILPNIGVRAQAETWSSDENRARDGYTMTSETAQRANPNRLGGILEILPDANTGSRQHFKSDRRTGNALQVPGLERLEKLERLSR